jgi:hypothetical protein
MRQSDDFELRQHRVPEKCVQGHDHRQPGIGLADENQRKRQQRADRTETHDGKPSTGVVASQPQMFGATQRISIGIATSSPMRAALNPR